MKEVIVRGKKVKVPFEDADYNLDGEENVTISNRFSGEKATVPGYAAAVYDVIIGAESLQDYASVQKGCDWFSRNFPNNIWCYLTSLNLLKYFISRDEKLPASYVKKCEKFLKEISHKLQAPRNGHN